jgi:hypothetical protein
MGILVLCTVQLFVPRKKKNALVQSMLLDVGDKKLAYKLSSNMVMMAFLATLFAPCTAYKMLKRTVQEELILMGAL